MSLIYLKHLWVLFSETHFIRLARKIRYYGPLLHFSYAAILFNGFILSFLTKNYLGWEVWLMYAVWLFVFMAEIKRYKKIRVIGSKDIAEQQAFIAYAKKLYAINLVLTVLTVIAAYL